MGFKLISTLLDLATVKEFFVKDKSMIMLGFFWYFCIHFIVPELTKQKLK